MIPYKQTHENQRILSYNTGFPVMSTLQSQGNPRNVGVPVIPIRQTLVLPARTSGPSEGIPII